MKKLAYLTVLALCLGFTSCDNYEEPNPTPQTNPQESILKTDELGVEYTLSSEVLYDLAELNNAGTPIQVAVISCSTLPATYNFAANVEISSNNFATSAVVPSTVTPGEAPNTYVVSVTPDALQGVYYSSISKGPKAKEISVRMSIMTEIGTQLAYVGGKNYYFGNANMMVLPFPTSLVIEDNYYLVGTINGWNVATAIKLNHSDANPYDDPVFTIAVDITNEQANEGWWWKILPESTVVTGDWVSGANAAYGVEVNGDESLMGILVANTNEAEAQAGCIKQAGQYLLTINMEEGTYSFTSAVPFLYTPGDANGWSQGASQLLYTTDYTNYYGYANLSTGGFKFTDAPDWNHTNYGDGGAPGVLSPTGDNISVAQSGLYWCEVNIASLTYKVTEITTIGIIGDATAGGWDKSTPLTPSADNLIWTGTVTLTNGEFKLRANDGWDVNLGGDMQNLQQGGDNLPSPGPGTYNVTLNLGQLPYSVTLTK